MEIGIEDDLIIFFNNILNSYCDHSILVGDDTQARDIFAVAINASKSDAGMLDNLGVDDVDKIDIGCDALLVCRIGSWK